MSLKFVKTPKEPNMEAPTQSHTNNADYVKKFYTYSKEQGKSNHITIAFRLGDTVIISELSDVYPDRVAKIILGADKKVKDKLNVQLKDGKKILVDKLYLSHICHDDYTKLS